MEKESMKQSEMLALRVELSHPCPEKGYKKARALKDRRAGLDHDRGKTRPLKGDFEH